MLSDPSGSASSLLSFSLSLYTTLTLACVICLSFLLCVSSLPTIHPPWHSLCPILILLPGIWVGSSFPGGELVPPFQVVHPVTKGTNDSRSSPAYGVDVMKPCHQRHQMSPDFCRVPSENPSLLPLA